MNYGFIGFGNMATAIYEGLKEERDLSFGYFSRSKKEENIPFFDNIGDLVAFADVIWLGIKPQDLADILTQLQPLDLSGKTIVSFIAGKSIAFIEQYVGKDKTIVRIMPNLAIAYKKSITSVVTNHHENEVAADIFKRIDTLGKAVELPEKQFDLFSSMFGSGPAFILAVLQSFEAKMIAFNLSDELSDEMLQMLLDGTLSYYAQNSGKCNIEELIRKITSKGGMTQAGLTFFKENHIDTLMQGVLNAATKRSIEMQEGGGEMLIVAR